MANFNIDVNATIEDGSIANAKLSDMPDATIKGRMVGAGTGDPVDLGPDRVSDILDLAIDPFVRTSALPADTGITQLTGDVTAGPGSGSQTATIANQVVTFAKMQHISTAHLLGRHASGTGDVQQIGIGGGLELNGANIRREALTGDVTASAGNNATTIANDAVTNAKMANMAQATIKGRQAGGGTGDPEDLTASEARTVLGLGTAAQVNTGTGSGDVPTTSQADARYLTPFAYSLLPAWTVGTQATTAVTLADVTNTELTVLGAGMYEFEYRVTYNANATTTGAGFTARNTVGGTADYASVETGVDTGSGDRSTFRGGFVVDLVAVSSRATTGNQCIVRGRAIFNAASAIRLQFRTEIVTTTTITVTDVIGFIRRVA
jgi:hypothetical protein